MFYLVLNELSDSVLCFSPEFNANLKKINVSDWSKLPCLHVVYKNSQASCSLHLVINASSSYCLTCCITTKKQRPCLKWTKLFCFESLLCVIKGQKHMQIPWSVVSQAKFRCLFTNKIKMLRMIFFPLI